MLTQEPIGESDKPAGSVRKLTPAAAAGLTLVVLVVLVLRHDYWNWDTPGYLLFGFLPVGLWWQGMVSILASVMMWLMVKFAWPAELEQQASAAERRRSAAGDHRSEDAA